MHSSSKKLIDKKTLLAMIPLCEMKGKFPRRIAVSSRKVVWDLAEVEEWIDTCRESGPAPRPGMAV